VFKQGEELFVAPSGGRMDDIVRAVRACPSDALSCEVNEGAPRALVDSERLPSIEVSKDGPYRTTGGIVLSDEDGEPAAQNLGASLEHYSLCAAGIRRTSPFAAACIGL
jgi:hypothetical protein